MWLLSKELCHKSVRIRNKQVGLCQLVVADSYLVGFLLLLLSRSLVLSPSLPGLAFVCVTLISWERGPGDKASFLPVWLGEGGRERERAHTVGNFNHGTLVGAGFLFSVAPSLWQSSSRWC